MELVEGRHGLAQLRRVPLFELELSEGLWLMNKAALLQLEHFNKSNALAWALTMGLFAMPVVYSDREWNQIVGESYYIQLGPEDKFGWTEPEGQGLPDRRGEPEAAARRDLPGLLPAAGGRSLDRGRRSREPSKQRDSRSRRRCCGRTATR